MLNPIRKQRPNCIELRELLKASGIHAMQPPLLVQTNRDTVSFRVITRLILFERFQKIMVQLQVNFFLLILQKVIF